MPNTIPVMPACVAPANTATKPMPPSNAIGNGIKQISTLPKVAPIKNSGVTSPPLKPALKVNAVNSIFINEMSTIVDEVDENNDKAIDELKAQIDLLNNKQDVIMEKLNKLMEEKENHLKRN